MHTCWAACLGNCSRKKSKEHIVSKSVFIGDELKIRGFPWCRQTPQLLPKESLESNILCCKHNKDLSHAVDPAGINAFRVFRKVAELSEQRARAVKNSGIVLPEQVKYTIDGPNLERWFLKTLINIVIVGKEKVPIGSNRGNAGEPSQELVEIAFGRKQFVDGAGIYFFSHAELTWDPNGEGVTCIPQILADPTGEHIVAGEFWFYGCPFFLNLMPVKIPLTWNYRGRPVKFLHRLSRIEPGFRS
jgi:hypothetical protein